MTKYYDMDNKGQKYDTATYDGESSIEIVILIVGLAIGIAVGLTVKKADDEDASSAHQSEGGITTVNVPLTTTKPHTQDWMDEPCMPPSRKSACPWNGNRVNPVLLISIDGFAADYLKRRVTPVLEKLRSCGVHTPKLRPVYPTVTIPNHYALSTGLYPAYSGIVEHNMYDPVVNKTFNTETGEEVTNPEWWGGEPIWITAKKQGRKTASYMWYWLASTVNVSGVLPDYVVPFNKSIPTEEGVDTVIEWLSLAENKRPDFITLYVDKLNETSHEYGPNSPQVTEMLRKTDATLHYLMNSLYRHGMDSCVNIIITSDQGMSETSCARQISLKSYMSDVGKMLVTDGTRGSIRGQYRHDHGAVVNNEHGKSTKEIMEALECKRLQLNVFTNATIPVRWHLSHRRIGDVIMRMEDRWIVSITEETHCEKGNNGYDNIVESMQALFVAHGPAFKQNFSAEPFERIELYNLMAEMLKIVPAPNNGTAGSLSYMLQGEPNQPAYGPGFKAGECSNIVHNRTSTCSCGTSYTPADSVNNDAFPFGVPAVEIEAPLCRFDGSQLTTFYSSEKKQPALSSFFLNKQQIEGYNSTTGSCILPDPRLNNTVNPDCTMYENDEDSIVHSQLFDPGLSTSSQSLKDAQLSSNMVSMYSGFKDGIWDYLWRLIKDYTSTYRTVHVSMGPVFDANSDGVADDSNIDKRYVKSGSHVLFPSHYYAILTKCSTSASTLSHCPPPQLQTLAFVLPHVNKTTNCLTNRDYLRDNVVRIRDIEVLTGFRFLTDLDKFISARKRTVLETELWPSTLLTPWLDLPCPIPDHAKCPPGKHPLLLISLDGFRADYLERHLTPVIQRLAQCGVHTPYMRSVYPTITFPNHYSIATGLYPESHGIVGNSMYDEEIDKVFSLSGATAKDPRWWKGEPIWNTAKKQGLKTATYFWPGSDVNISGMYPDIYKKYDGKAGFTSRVYEVLDWLTMPVEERPDFITLYFNEPDHMGHEGGPQSEQVNGALETVDGLIDLLMTNLYEKDLHHCVNFIVLADHGMSNQSCSRKVMLKDFLPNVSDMLVFDRYFGNIMPQFKADPRHNAHRHNASDVQHVDEIVANLTCKHSAMKVFTKDTLPRRHHFFNSPRIGDVMVDMKDEWLVFGKYNNWCDGGMHGWDNTYKHMHALFLAYGPIFKTNFTTEPFENIEVYNLMTEILNITSAPNNGTQGTLSHILRTQTEVAGDLDLQTPSACTSNNGPLTTTCGCQKGQDLASSLLTDSDMIMFGVPFYSRGDSLCLIHQVGSTAAFSHTVNSPVWLATVITNQTRLDMLAESSCVAADTRVTYWNSTKCQNDSNQPDIHMAPLLGLGLTDNGNTVILSTTMVPLYDGFRNGIWKSVKGLISNYVQLYGDVSVMSGPLYDYNNDGLVDNMTDIERFLFNETDSPVPVPTHLFVRLVKCKATGQSLPCAGHVDILSFILPHTPDILNCLSPQVYLKDNVARLRDIELLSGIQFMAAYNTSYSARLRTFLPESLWTSTLYTEWKDLPCPHQDQCASDYKPLLLISLDGFRADYLQRKLTPTLARLSQCGVHAPYMRSVYPTKTFPNHYSIVTGLYPESHGIIDNNMYDVNLEQRFRLGSPASKNPKWWMGEPIWLTAKRQGLKTATFFWPGSDVKINGTYPDYWKAYDGKVTYYERVKQVLTWMTMSAKQRPDFITLYFDEPDLAGHRYGPDGQGVNDALQRVDDIISVLIEGLVENQLHNCVNLVIIADHGMADIDCDRIVRLNEHTDYSYLSRSTWVWDGAFGRIANTYLYNKSSSDQISPTNNPASTDSIFSNLTCASPHLDLYRKSTLPVRHHYSNNDRIDDIILDVQSDWLVARSYARSCKGGSHGYDNIAKSMQALFLAYGPAFKWNYSVDAFENIELYNMFTEILNVTAAPNNGTMGSLNHILQSPPPTRTTLFDNAVVGTPSLDKDAYLNYVKTSQCGNICVNVTEDMLHGLYNRVTGTPTTVSDLPKLPQTHSPNITILQHEDFVIGYNTDIHTTVWIKGNIKNGTELKRTAVDCVVPDPLIQHGDNTCFNKHQDYRFGPLLLIGESEIRHLSTVYADMKVDFIADVWMPLQQLIGNWTIKYGDLDVITGPVYDFNYDSLPDNATTVRSHRLPSHFYSIVSRCLQKTDTACMELQTFSVIVPHSTILNCKTFEAYIEDNECRIRDIELITGLQFFTHLSHDQSVRLKTYLPNGLWNM